MNLRAAYTSHLAAVEHETIFVPFVRGEAERIERCAVAVKRCLGVAAENALDPWDAASHAGIEVRGAQFFATLAPEVQRQVLVVGGGHWSAGTVVGNGSAIVFLNPTHEITRQKATLAEELAHIVIGHPPSKIDPVTGFRTYDADVENEAYGVGGAMILPYGQLFGLVKRRQPTRDIAERYAVSEPFVNYRINRAGLRRMYANARGA